MHLQVQPLRVLCVGHAMKETLTAGDCRRSLESGVRAANCVVVGGLCISDGGDGFLEAFAEGRSASYVEVSCTGPLGDEITSEFLLDSQSKIAAIESARACGLALVPPEKRDVMRSTTAGLGDLVADAIMRGALRVLIGLGGSATTDGGAGMITRLCERLLQEQVGPPRMPFNMQVVDTVLIIRLRERLSGVELIACTDVDSPLLGENGSAARFGPQKGATPAQVEELERTLTAWADAMERELGEDWRHVPGAGAAGGLGFAVLALGGRLRPGADMFLDLFRFDDAVKKSDVVVTCEGRFDSTSLQGKAPWKVAERARLEERAVAIVCGSAESAAAAKAESDGISIVPFAESVAPADRKARAGQLVQETTASYLRQLDRYTLSHGGQTGS